MAIALKKEIGEYLAVGDKITVAITHEVKINRDSAWIRYEATSNVADDETSDMTKQRVINHVSKAVVEAAEAAAERAM